MNKHCIYIRKVIKNMFVSKEIALQQLGQECHEMRTFREVVEKKKNTKKLRILNLP